MGCGLSKPWASNFADEWAGCVTGPPFSSVRPSAATIPRPLTSMSVGSPKSRVTSSVKRSRGEIQKSSIPKPILIDWSESDFGSEGQKSRRETDATTATNSWMRMSIMSMSSTSSFELMTPIKRDVKEIVVERRSVSPPRSSESPGRPQLVTVKKQDLNRSLTMPVYKPTGVPPVAAPYHLSESDLPKDAVPDIPQIPAKHPKDLPKLRAPFLRLPSIDESAFEPFRQNFRKSKSQLSSPSDTESPTSDTKDSRLSITTVATSLYSPEDDGPMPTDSMELPLHFHPDSDGEDTIVCGLPCTDPHRAQELQYTLDVLTGECPRRIDEEAIAMQDIIMGKKLGSNVAVKRAPVPQPVKPSGLVGMFAGAKERKKMEMQLLRRFKGEKTTAQRQKRKIL